MAKKTLIELIAADCGLTDAQTNTLKMVLKTRLPLAPTAPRVLYDELAAIIKALHLRLELVDGVAREIIDSVIDSYDDTGCEKCGVIDESVYNKIENIRAHHIKRRE